MQLGATHAIRRFKATSCLTSCLPAIVSSSANVYVTAAAVSSSAATFRTEVQARQGGAPEGKEEGDPMTQGDEFKEG